MKRKLVVALIVALAVTASVPTTAKVNDNGYLKNLLSQNKSKVLERSASSGKVDFVNYDTKNGAPVFIRGNLSKDKISNEEDAAKYLKDNMDAFNLKIGEFELLTAEKDKLGFIHYKFAYEVDGIEVRGSQIILHTNKDSVLYAVNGSPENEVTDKKYSKDFKIDSNKAIDIAGKDSEVEDISNITSSKVIKNVDGTWLSVYEVLVPTGSEGILYTIKATDGTILNKTKTAMGLSSSQVKGKGTDGIEKTVNAEVDNGIYYLRDITRNGSIEVTNTDDPNETLYSSSSPEFIDKQHEAVVDGLYNMGKTYDYFLKEQGRDSYDGKGGDILVDANQGTSDNIISLLGSSLNAYCMAPGLFGFGEGAKIEKTFTLPISETETVNIDFKADVNNFIAQPDIVAHEFTHAVTNTTSGLLYENQSGALNESFSDVFGVIVEGDKTDWGIGEDLGTYSIDGVESSIQRSMENPEKFNQPGNMKEYQDLPMDYDQGGVHINSGIPNKAFYNVASKIGFEKAGNIYYRALTSYLVPSSQFIDARAALEMAALDLYGEEMKKVVSDGFDAVGVTYDNSSAYKPTLSAPGVYVDQIKNSGNFNLKVSVNKGNTAKSILILDSMTGEVILNEKIDPSKEEWKKSIKFENMAEGAYGYLVLISDDESFTLEDLFTGAVNINAGQGLTLVGQELPVQVLPAIINWEEDNIYKVGQTVTLNGDSYVCRQSHTSQNGWEPNKVPALWMKLPK